MTSSPQLVLASGSPRRRDLLEALGLSFEVRPADIDETPEVGELPEELVERLALSKARHSVERGEVVLAADTVVVCDGEILGKPRNREDTVRMLGKIQGRAHVVFTGIAVAVGPAAEQARSEIVRTTVQMAEMTDAEIDWYSRTGEPDDKAGAYAIQGIGALFVRSIEGNYTNVVGLPLPRVYALLRALGHDLRRFE